MFFGWRIDCFVGYFKGRRQLEIGGYMAFSKNVRLLLFLLISGLFSSSSFAELISPVVLTPASNAYSTGATSDPLRHAWTYEAGAGDGHDIWTFDMTGFDSNYLVTTSLYLQDYCCHADNYNLYWDSVFIGSTGIGTAFNSTFDTTAGIHTLEIEWTNPIPGGSWYNIAIDTTQGPLVTNGVPVPPTAALMLLGALGLVYRRQRSIT